MKRLLASATILLIILVHFSNIAMSSQVLYSSPDTTTNTLEITTYFNGSLLVESAIEITDIDPDVPEVNATLTFLEENNVTSIQQHISILQPTDFPYISLDGTIFYEEKTLNGEIDITPEFGLPLENSVMDLELNETTLHLNASGTILYETFLTYDFDNETIKEAIDEIKNGGFNQSSINSTIYGPTDGEVECTELSISALNGTSSADISLSMTLEGDIYLGLVLLTLNFTGQSFPSETLKSTISEVIDDTFALITNSTITLSYNTEGLLVIESSTYLIGTFNDDLQSLKNKLLANFLGGIDGFNFFHLTDFHLKEVDIGYNCDSEEASFNLKGLHMNPPVDILNTTDFDIPGLFDGLSNIDPFFDNITLIIEGEKNATDAVVVVVPEGIPQPDEDASVIWLNVELGDLEAIWFRVLSIPPEFWILSYEAMIWFATLSSVVSFVVVLSAMYRKRFLDTSTMVKKTKVKNKKKKGKS